MISPTTPEQIQLTRALLRRPLPCGIGTIFTRPRHLLAPNTSKKSAATRTPQPQSTTTIRTMIATQITISMIKPQALPRTPILGIGAISIGTLLAAIKARNSMTGHRITRRFRAIRTSVTPKITRSRAP